MSVSVKGKNKPGFTFRVVFSVRKACFEPLKGKIRQIFSSRTFVLQEYSGMQVHFRLQSPKSPPPQKVR